MKTKHDILQMVLSVLYVLLGNAIYAATIKFFFLSSNIIVGGTNGIALFINHFTGMNIPLFVLIFNVVMLLLGLFILGKKFAMTTIVSTFAYPIILELLNRIFGDFVLTTDPMLCTIFTGLGVGLALGIVIRSGASTGGMDIPPLILNKLFKIPVSVGLYVFDICILLLQIPFTPVNYILYGIILTLLYTLVLDKLLTKGTSKTELKIISNHAAEIRSAILSDMDRGVTIIYGKGGYLQQPSHILLSVISNRELPQIQRLVQQIDPESFIIINRVSEVRGRGFSLSKTYE